MPPPFFPDFIRAAPAAPPTRGLELWLEGETLAADRSGIARSWPDRRGESTAQVRPWTRPDFSLMSGTVATSTIRLPATSSPATRAVNALRCGEEPRCAYVLVDPAAANRPRLNVLTGRPYAIFVVASRASNRGDQYVVMTDGTGCSDITGISCTANTALHLGWNDERMLRLDQYAKAVTMGVPAFNRTAFDAGRPERSLLVGQAGAAGKLLALLEPLANRSATATDTRPLDTSNRLYVGGTAFIDNNPVPNWHFVGDIFAVLIYSVELTIAERADVTNYLRARYGPV